MLSLCPKGYFISNYGTSFVPQSVSPAPTPASDSPHSQDWLFITPRECTWTFFIQKVRDFCLVEESVRHNMLVYQGFSQLHGWMSANAACEVKKEALTLWYWGRDIKTWHLPLMILIAEFLLNSQLGGNKNDMKMSKYISRFGWKRAWENTQIIYSHLQWKNSTMR